MRGASSPPGRALRFPMKNPKTKAKRLQEKQKEMALAGGGAGAAEEAGVQLQGWAPSLPHSDAWPGADNERGVTK